MLQVLATDSNAVKNTERAEKNCVMAREIADMVILLIRKVGRIATPCTECGFKNDGGG